MTEHDKRDLTAFAFVYGLIIIAFVITLLWR
jgi:hypothetical protein